MGHKQLTIIIIFFVLISGLLLNSDLPLGNDESLYYVLAKSISMGKGMNDLYMTGDPPHVTHPFFFPSLLSLAFWMPGREIIPMKAVSLISGILFLFALFSLAKGMIPAELMIFFMAAVAFNLWLLHLSALIVPEVLFLLISIAVLLFFRSFEKTGFKKKRYFIAVVVSSLFLFYTKALGCAAMLAITLYLVSLKKIRVAILMCLIWALFISPWAIRNHKLSKKAVYRSYTEQISAAYNHSILNVPGGIIYNMVHYPLAVPKIFMPGYFLGELRFEGMSYFYSLHEIFNKNILIFPLMSNSSRIFTLIMSYSILALIITGFLHYREKTPLMNLYCLSYMLPLMIFHPDWYTDAGNRYIFCIFPFLLIYFIAGVIKLAKKSRIHAKTPVFVLLIFLIYNLFPAIESVKGNVRYLLSRGHSDPREHHPFWLMEYFTAAQWIRQNTDEDSIIMARFPPTFYLYSGRKTEIFHLFITPPHERKTSEIADDILRKGIDYLVATNTLENAIALELDNMMDDVLFVPVKMFSAKFENKIIVYRLEKINPAAKKVLKKAIGLLNGDLFKDALNSFREASELEPDSAAVYFYYGECFRYAGQTDRAEGMYRKALDLDPAMDTARDTLGSLKDGN